MYEQDYIMRLIKEMVRTLLKLLFNIDSPSPSAELLENDEQRQTLESLLNMIDEGRINEAENRLYDIIETSDRGDLKTALLFSVFTPHIPKAVQVSPAAGCRSARSGPQRTVRPMFWQMHICRNTTQTGMIVIPSISVIRKHTLPSRVKMPAGSAGIPQDRGS